MSVLFITIGNRDVQYVYDHNGQKVRMGIYGNKENLSNLALPYITLDKISSEENRDNINEIKDKQPIGITFPMIEKALKYIQEKGKAIDSIILISTIRKTLETKLEELFSFSLDKNWFEAATIADDLLYYAKRDRTSSYSDIIGKRLSESYQVKSINIGSKHPVLKKLIETDIQNYSSEEDLIAGLGFADFNTYKLMYPEIQNAIVTIYDDLRNKTIFLSLAGGMPIMQRVLEHIIRSSFYKQTVHSISIPEKDTFIKQDQQKTLLTLNDNYEYIEFIENKNQLIHFLQKLNFTDAEKKFEEIKKFINNNAKKISDIMDRFKGVFELQKSKKLDKIFIMLYTKILSAIYEENFTYLAVLLKILQERTLKRVIKLQSVIDRELKYKERSNKNQIYNDEIEYCSKIYKNLDFFHQNYQYITENPILKKFNDIFLHKKYSEWNENFKIIKTLRDHVIHEALTFVEDRDKSSFINFLRIDSEKLNSVKRSVKSLNITEEVMDFENNFMGENSTFFKIKNLWFKDDKIKFDLRKSANEIIDLLLKLELK